MGNQQQRRGTVGEINIDRKDRRTLRITSKNHRLTAAELNIHLEVLFPQKLSDVSFLNPTSPVAVGLQLLHLLFLKVML
jgi:hypothetical protein